jgi:FkbM family methyltransferase
MPSWLAIRITPKCRNLALHERSVNVMLNNLKQMILGTQLAQLAMNTREKIELIYAACFRISDLGTLANDHLATYLITRFCAPGKIFIDIGAHIGSVVSSVQTHVPSATIIAIEPIPEKVVHLRRSFPTVRVHQVALGDSEGSVKFFIDTKQSGYSSLSRPAERDAKKMVEITVPMTRLDQLVDSNAIDAIKIDVEGTELDVLRGSVGTITRNRPIIMYESGPPAGGQMDSEKTPQWQFFRNNNYILVVPNRLAHNDDGLTREGYIESHLYPRRTTNYFAVPIERQSEYRDRARRILSVT